MPSRSLVPVSGESPLYKKPRGRTDENSGSGCLSATRSKSLPPVVNSGSGDSQSETTAPFVAVTTIQGNENHPNETTTPFLDALTAKRKRPLVTKSSSTNHLRPSGDDSTNNSESLAPPRALFADAPPCEGISQGLEPKWITTFVGGAFRAMGNELMEMAGRESDASTFFKGMGEGDLARFQDLVCRRVNGEFIIVKYGCTGRATEAAGQRLLRCEICRKSPQHARRQLKYFYESAERETATTTENIKFIAQNPQKAEHEILSLREQVKQLQLKLKEYKGKGEGEEETTDPKVLIEQLKGLIDVEIRKEKDNRKNCPVTQREMWLTHTKHMLNVFAADGNMRKVVQEVAQVDWAIVLHARTSNRVYNEISKVMKLPHISTIYRKGNELVSSSSSRAYSLCTQTLAAISRTADEQNWSDNQRLVFIAVDSANGVAGVEWDYTRQMIVGGCQEYKFQPMRRLFNTIADSQQNNSNEEGDGIEYVGSIIDNMKLAQEHCVAKASGIAPDIKLSEVVASTNCGQFSAEVVKQMVHLIHQTTPNFKVYPIGVAYDAANPNLSAVKACATHAVGKYLPSDLKAKYPAIDFDGLRQIMLDVLGDPFLFLSDVMHCAKANHTTLEKSSSPQSKRCLMYMGCPMTLKMVELVWRRLGGASNQMQPTKLSELTFNRDSKSRMDCTETCRLFSKSAATMIQHAIDDDEVELGNFKKKVAFNPLKWYIQHMNDLIDITNGKLGHYEKGNGREIQEKLLNILDWFSKWKKDHDERITKGPFAFGIFLLRGHFESVKYLINSSFALVEIRFFFVASAGGAIGPPFGTTF